MKEKDPIKALENLRSWNKDCSDAFFRPLKHDWPEFYELTKSIGSLFVTNQDVINEIIKEMKKLKKRKKK